MKFSAFNLKKEIVEILEQEGYSLPTEIQQIVIPKALRGENFIAQSETGSGKSHSFIIPILNNLTEDEKIQAIIISPTRELVKQTYDFIYSFNKYINNLSVKMFISGKDSDRDLKSIINSTKIVIATPGRLNYLLKNSSLDLSKLQTIVLDEADMLFEKGFLDDIDQIISNASKPQIEVFSATISKSLSNFVKKYINADFIYNEDDNRFTSKNVEHIAINDKHKNVKDLLIEFIHIINPFKLFIFTNSKKECKEIYNFLITKGYESGILSGELEARERKSMLRRIKNNEFSIIVCTDIAGRGIDIEDVSEVLSLSLPNSANIEYYFHRAGRTGRNNKKGVSYFFYNQDDLDKINTLKSKGCKILYTKIVDNKLIDDNSFSKKYTNRKKGNSELENKIKKVKNLTKSKKVKPNYKKKVKTAIQKVKQEHRREIIKKDIKRQKEERYRNANKNKF